MRLEPARPRIDRATSRDAAAARAGRRARRRTQAMAETERLARSHRRAAGRALRGGTAGAARGAAGPGHGGQGRHDPEGVRAARPAGRHGDELQGAVAEELAHDYLWRIHRAVPPAAPSAIFNRSHYEDVLVVRVHELVPEAVWRPALRADHAVRADPDRERGHDPQVLPAHLAEGAAGAAAGAAGRSRRSTGSSRRATWPSGSGGTSTPRRIGRRSRGPARAEAPWYVVPADKKYLRDVLVAQVVAETLERMDPKYPGPPAGLEAVQAGAALSLSSCRRGRR